MAWSNSSSTEFLLVAMQFAGFIQHLFKSVKASTRIGSTCTASFYLASTTILYLSIGVGHERLEAESVGDGYNDSSAGETQSEERT